MRLRLQPITAELFAPFGTLHERPAPGNRERIDMVMANGRAAAALRLLLTTKAPAALPFAIPELERHPFSTQTFVPVDAGPWLVVVAPPHGDGRSPDAGQARGFLMRADQGVTYAMGAWHAPLMTLERPGCFVTSIWRDGGAGDEEFAALADPLEIEA